MQRKKGMVYVKRVIRFLNIILVLFLITINNSRAQAGFNIYLVGDAGDHTYTAETLSNLQKELIQHPNSAVIFLGDNCYKDILWGIIPFGFKGFDSSRNTQLKLKAQLNILNNFKGSAFFTPGNHDWWNRTTYRKGKDKLFMEESFIEKSLSANTSISNPGNVFLPANGEYGPVYVELNNRTIRLVFMDTYRIIQTGIRKSPVPDEEKTVYSRLDSILRDGYALKQKIVIVAHHPVYAKGPYAQPLKSPGLFKRIKASNMNFPSYQAMSDQMNQVLRKYPGVYYASGHVHALQYFYTRDRIHYIVSGAGSKVNKLSEKEITRYASDLPNEYLYWNTGGFVEIQFNGLSERHFIYYHDGEMKCSPDPD